MAQKFLNNAHEVLSGNILAAATSIVLVGVTTLPTLGAGDYFYAALVNTSNDVEYVKCTAITGNTLTVTRGLGGTAARAFSSGDHLELRLIAESIRDITNGTNAGSFTSVVAANVTLPDGSIVGWGSSTAYVQGNSTSGGIGVNVPAGGAFAVVVNGSNAAVFSAGGLDACPIGDATPSTGRFTTAEVVSGGSGAISTGVGSVRMTTGNTATNAIWIPIKYAGVTYFIPGYAAHNP